MGQVFIRENGLNIKWRTDDNGKFVADISFKEAYQTESKWFGFFLASVVLISLSVYLAILTVIKFRRIKEQNEQFKKIKILTSNYELDISPDFAEVFKAQQQDQDFIEGKDGALTSTQHAVDVAIKSGLTPKASGLVNLKQGLTPKAGVSPKKAADGSGMFILTPKSSNKTVNLTDRLKND